MRAKRIPILLALVLAFAVTALCAPAAMAGPYTALQGAKSADAVFDVRAKSAGSLLLAMGLVHAMYKDPAIRQVSPKPKFTVIFIGPAVKLVTTSRKGVSPADAKLMDKLDGVLAAMAKDGIKLELCVFAAKLLKVDLATILPVIEQVPNGWISLIGYEQRGFALVPIY